MGIFFMGIINSLNFRRICAVYRSKPMANLHPYESYRSRSQFLIVYRWLHEIGASPFIPIYRNAHEEMAAAGAAHASLTADLNLVIEPGADRRRENLPTASEVAAIVPRSTRSTQEHLLLRVSRVSLSFGEPGWAR
jgi:hypothetical protein